MASVRQPERVLRRCFTDSEWKTLMKNRCFAEAIPNAHTLEDIERLATLGSDILGDCADFSSRRFGKAAPIARGSA
jgi:hypothetical protein